jgi:asparagine synthetase B (glutamine-hydrolysing)
MTAIRTGLAVKDFIWQGEQFVETLDLSNPEDRTGVLADAVGQFGLHQHLPSGEHVLARDPLGVNKLFFVIDSEGEVESANYWIELIRRGHPADAIWSVPSGHLLTVTPERQALSLMQYAQLEFNDTEGGEEQPVTEHARRIERRLTSVFRSIGKAVGNRPLYVSLSGGLDSTTIAVLASELIGEFTAVSFAVDSGTGHGPASEDLSYASRVAADLGVRFEAVVVTPDDVLSLLDTVLLYGQDWRDFNVHCALVNAAIGRAIRERHAAGYPEAPPLLLTGDVMNELMVDYTAVPYHGHDFYRLPRLSPARLRRLLVAGLDAGDREVGVLRYFGVDVIQPYAMCAGAYAALPARVLESPQAKQRLVRAVMGDKVPGYVYKRPKTRAQAGGSNTIAGTLSVLIDRGIDGRALEERFAQLFAVDRASLGQFIRSGLYRFTSTYPA